MIKFFVCSDEGRGCEQAFRQGWLPIARNRFVENPDGPAADRHEIRLVTRLADFQWTPGLVFIRGQDFGRCRMCKGSGKMGKKSDCPACEGSGTDPEAAKFESLVSSGQARWWGEDEEVI